MQIQALSDFKDALNDQKAMYLEVWTALTELASNPVSTSPAPTPTGGSVWREVSDCSVRTLSAAGGPDFERSVEVDRTTVEQMNRRNRLPGLNHRVIGNGLLVMFYHRWDEYFRPKIETELGRNKDNRIQADIFGDIKSVRNDIVHNKGISDKASSLRLLTSVPKGQEIDWHIDNWLATISWIEKWIDSMESANANSEST
jgi:hypothetical protein